MRQELKPLYWVALILLIGVVGIVYFSVQEPKADRNIAPAFTVVTLDGKTIGSNSLRGKPLFLNFWSSW